MWASGLPKKSALSEHNLPLSVETDASNCVFYGSPFSMFCLDDTEPSASFTEIVEDGVT